MSIRYQDARITCDDDGITIARYYFPFGGPKRVSYDRIRRIQVFPMGFWTGRYRIWGTSDPRYWLNYDPERPRKQTLIVLDVGAFVRPTITPDDPGAVLAVLEERTGHGAESPGR